MKDPHLWTEALDDLLTRQGEGSTAERAFRALGRMAGVRAVAIWTRVRGAGWLRTRSRGPENLLPPGSVVEAYLEGRLQFSLPPGRHVLTVPGGRDALAVVVDLGFDPDLLEALLVVLVGSSSASPRDTLEALSTLVGDIPGLKATENAPTEEPRTRPPTDAASQGLGELFRTDREEDSNGSSEAAS